MYLHMDNLENTMKTYEIRNKHTGEVIEDMFEDYASAVLTIEQYVYNVRITLCVRAAGEPL
jgi:hypothetical protein